MAATYGAKTRDIKGGELVVHEESIIFCRDSAKVAAATNPTDPTVTDDPVGLPVKIVGDTYTFATAAEITAEATTPAGVHFGLIVVADPIVAALADTETTLSEVAILKQGPAVINEGRLPAADAYGGAIVAANLLTVLAAVDIDSIPISPTRETQTT